MPASEKVWVQVGVKTWMQSTLFVSNEVMRILLDILAARRLNNSRLLHQREVISRGLFTGLVARELCALHLEIHQSGSDQAEERWTFYFLYEYPTSAEIGDLDWRGVYRSYWDEIKGILAQLTALPDGMEYWLVGDVAEDALPIPGWIPTPHLRADHLRKISLGEALCVPAIIRSETPIMEVP